MKSSSALIVSAVLGLLLFSFILSGISFGTVVSGGTQNALTVQLSNVGSGQSSLTNITHSSPSAARLVIPTGAQVNSASMVLYPYNKSLSSLQSFQVYASYTSNPPRFVVQLDTNADGIADAALLSDYLLAGSGDWQLCQGGLRWGWTRTSLTLSAYGDTWGNFTYWKAIYANATALSVGIALEYWALSDQNGLDKPLYADEVIINGVTYNIANPLPVSATQDDWAMYRHDPQNTGVSQSTGSSSVFWQFYIGEKIHSSPAVVNGILYEGSNDGILYALNASTGALIWRYNSGSSQIESSPAVVNDIVYVGILWDGQHGYVDAVNATTGARVWRFVTNSGVESSPSVVNGVVYIGSYSGYLYALNATSGAAIWIMQTNSPMFSSPAVVNGVVYIGNRGGAVYAVNAKSGTIAWVYQADSAVYASPSVVNGTVYFNSDSGAVYALRASDGQKIWQANIGVGTDHADDSPAVAYGLVYVGSRNGYYALNATDGSKVWFFASPYSQRQFTGYVYSSPAVAGNTVYLGYSDSYVFALDAFNGSVVGAYLTGGFLFSSPAIADGTIYIGSYDGYVYALGGLTTSYLPPLSPPPQPTAAPTPAPTSTPAPTPTATANPTSTPAPKSIPKPTTTPHPSRNPILSNQAADNTIAYPTITPETIQPPEESINWFILAALAVIAVIAIVTMFRVFRTAANNES